MSKDYFQGRSVDEEQRRDELRYWARVVLVMIFAIALGGAMRWAFAEEKPPTYSVEDGSGNVVRILSEPCADTAPWLGLQKAEMRYEGVEYLACWFVISGVVVILDSNGDATPIPAHAFTKDEPL